MCCFVILLLSNEMQMSLKRFSAIPHLRASEASYGLEWTIRLSRLFKEYLLWPNKT